MRIARALVVASYLGATIAPASAAPDRPVAVLARAGASLADRDADRARCQKVVAASPGADMPGVARTPVPSNYGDSGMAGAIGGSIVFLIFALIEDGKAH